MFFDGEDNLSMILPDSSQVSDEPPVDPEDDEMRDEMDFPLAPADPDDDAAWAAYDGKVKEIMKERAKRWRALDAKLA